MGLKKMGLETEQRKGDKEAKQDDRCLRFQ